MLGGRMGDILDTHKNVKLKLATSEIKNDIDKKMNWKHFSNQPEIFEATEKDQKYQTVF